MTAREISRLILDLTAERGPEKSVCPSEVARQLDPEDWRALMPQVREVAGKLQAEGKIHITQGGEKVDIRAVTGPIRLSITPEEAEKSS